MKLTVLVDNNTIIDSYYLAEPALSFYIEDEDKKILFDLGYSDVFKKNAKKMKIDLNKIDTLVLSHGHNDHTGGLKYLENKNEVRVIAHPLLDGYKEYKKINISCPIKLEDMSDNFIINKTKEATKISEHVYYLGEIERKVELDTGLGNDPLNDDSALVYKNDEGIFIITACSHSGICNIIEQAKEVTKTNKILGIIGGFHLLDDDKKTNAVCEYLAHEDIEIIYPCHCTDLKAKIALSKVLPIKEVGVGFSLEV